MSAVGKIKPDDLMESDWVGIGDQGRLPKEGAWRLWPLRQVDSSYVNLRGKFYWEGNQQI